LLLFVGTQGRALRGEAVPSQPQAHALPGHFDPDDQSDQLDHRRRQPAREDSDLGEHHLHQVGPPRLGRV
jgi:hypothetical protein